MERRSLTRAAWAGLAYFGIVFATGFALGTLRVLAVTPRLGENAAVLLELPIILTLSWVACRWLISRFDVPRIGPLGCSWAGSRSRSSCRGDRRFGAWVRPLADCSFGAVSPAPGLDRIGRTICLRHVSDYSARDG